MAWRAVYSGYRQELAARDELKELGIAAFCPYETVTERRLVRRATGQTRIVTEDRPIYNRYLFADCDDKELICSARTVSGVVTSGEGFMLTVRERDMLRLFAAADEHGRVDRVDKTRLSLGFEGRVGDTFEFVEGAFAGFPGKITSLAGLDSHAEVGAEVEIFGRSLPITAPYQSVGHVVRKGAPHGQRAAVGVN